MKNFSDYIYFVYVGSNPKYSFRNYVDPETGHERGYVTGYDKNNQPIYKEWYFDYEAKRQVRVSANEKDKSGQLAVDFLRSSPEFYGSQNGVMLDNKQVLYKFKEINEDKDAREAVESRAVVIEAQAKALKLKGKELEEISNIIGIFTKKEDIMTHRVLDFSANFPKKFIEILEDPARKTKALVKRAINDKVFAVDGRLIKWEGKTIGADEDEAVSNIMKDKTLKEAIELNLAKFGS